jgi:hypothetical protein
MRKPPLHRLAPRNPILADVLRFQPTDADVEALIERAPHHPLGLDFLRHGELGSVAVSLDAHAFTVIAARERLSAGAPEPPAS